VNTLLHFFLYCSKFCYIEVFAGYKATHGKQQIPCHEFDGFYYAKLKKIAFKK
jgi:hypothetical protein